MKLGVCTSPENAFLAAAAGFDYVECALNALAAMSEEDFLSLLAQSKNFPIPVSKANCLFPADIPVVGPDVCVEKIRAYLDHAFSRAARLGVKVAVFGSGRSRTYPEATAFGDAWQQVEDFLRLAAPHADKYDIDIAIEPLRPKECNLINLVSEATTIARAVNHPRIGVLGDTFHMLSSQEPWENLVHAQQKLYHMHISHTLPDLSGRIYPRCDDGEDYAVIFRTLHDMGYSGDISVEAGTSSFSEDGAEAVHCLRPML